EHLEVALRMGLGEVLGVRGVAYLPVQGDDVRTGADRGQRLAEGQPGGHLVARFVAGQRYLAVAPTPGGPALRPRPADREMALAAQLDNRPLGHLGGQRPAVPALAVLALTEPAALAGAGQAHGRPAVRRRPG